jgi:hypothetical protein
MIEAAQRKLREAKFFYRHLADARYRHDADPETFRFYFSAFIGAARSVTWAMKSEESERYVAWEPLWKAQLSPEDQNLEALTINCGSMRSNASARTCLLMWKRSAPASL